MDPLGSRELAYFVAVAEELHFGRAAERLGITQPAVSRAVRQLERRLGVALLDRTSRSVRLTPAGTVLLTEGAKALIALDAAARRTRRAAEPSARLVVAVKPAGDAGLLSAILTTYEAQLDAVPVDVVACHGGRQVELLRTGQADVAFVHREHADLSGLHAEDLVAEPQVALLSRGHRLADREHLRVADLEGEIRPHRLGAPADDAAAPVVHDVAQLQQLVALGRMVAVVPASLCDHLRQDVTWAPVVDASPTTLAIAWSHDEPSPAVAGFVRTARRVACRKAAATADTTATPRTR